MAVIYSIPRERPRRKIKFSDLEDFVNQDDHGILEILPFGHVAVLQSELGFMELNFHVSLYRRRRDIFGRNFMVLVTTTELRGARLKDGQLEFQELVKELKTIYGLY